MGFLRPHVAHLEFMVYTPLFLAGIMALSPPRSILISMPNESCSMSGVLKDGKCACDRAFDGDNCVALHQYPLPENFRDGIIPVFGGTVTLKL